MKKNVSILAVLLICGLTMWAQSQAGTTDQSAGTGTASTQSQNSGNSPYGQSSSSNPSSGSSMSQSSSGASSNPQTVEGCIVREETDYYIVPEQGSAQKLSGNTADLGQHVGHHVTVKGTSTSASSATSGGTSGSSAANQQFTVAEVDMISDNCPSNWNPSEMQNYQSSSGKTGK
jgi:outer membrane protein assembly factor BamA